MSTIVTLIIQLISGAVGGNLAGMLKNLSLGPIGNTIAGAVGGLGGGWLAGLIPGMEATAAAGGTADIGSILTQVVGGGAGGAVLTGIAGYLKNMMGGRTA